ncbi:MAG: YidC/Oxa1 family membrane protein insertase [Candidatus Moduliflexus flocculans]|nr:YidC/Oxa1 family membrane protein insertase [Candidatus Moduliflexus flocculans]
MKKMQELKPEIDAIQARYGKLKATDPGQAEDEPGGHGGLQAARREPRQRLRADAPDDADPVRVLLDAGLLHRAARRAVRLLDQGPVGLRSVLRRRRS